MGQSFVDGRFWVSNAHRGMDELVCKDLCSMVFRESMSRPNKPPYVSTQPFTAPVDMSHLQTRIGVLVKYTRLGFIWVNLCLISRA